MTTGTVGDPTVRDRLSPEGGLPSVVVAVSPRTGSPAAVRWAVEEAAWRSTSVRAVMAWRPPRPPAAPAGRPPGLSATGPDDPAAAAQQELEAAVERALGPTGARAVECIPVRGSARAVLLAASVGAALLVLDAPDVSRLAAGPSRMLAPRLIARASCPIVLLPPPEVHDPTVEAAAVDPDRLSAKVRRAGVRLAEAAARSAASAGRPGLGGMSRPPS